MLPHFQSSSSLLVRRKQKRGGPLIRRKGGGGLPLPSSSHNSGAPDGRGFCSCLRRCQLETKSNTSSKKLRRGIFYRLEMLLAALLIFPIFIMIVTNMLATPPPPPTTPKLEHTTVPGTNLDKSKDRMAWESDMESSYNIGHQCLDLNLNQDLDAMVSHAQQIFVTMPAKAGGNSMNDFTIRCGHTGEVDPGGLPFGFIENSKYKDFLDKPIQNSSSIITSHIRRDTSLIHLVKGHSNERVLIIYIHRDEEERTISGIKMIADHMCKTSVFSDDEMGWGYAQSVIAKNTTHCIIDEESMGEFIARGHREVGGGSSSTLTCALYDALQFNHPEFVFVHYKQVDKLQTLLAKNHCPGLLDELPIRKNIAAEKQMKIFLHKRKGDANNETGIEEVLGAKGVVQIEDWLDAKGPVLEGALASLSQINERIASCQEETAQMQSKLLGCVDEALKVTYA